jgi:exodeoxyribonuclease VII large subunit
MTVGELNRTVKASIEDRFNAVWVEGEITAIKTSGGTGHVYFDLKDDREDARIACVLWKSAAQKSRARLVAGERVQLRGKPTLYAPRGQFQFVAESAVPVGAGAAAAALAALKAKLQIEGLFAPERKRALPRFPRVIGVVTSPSGAAFHDICRAVHQRWPVRIVLAPSLVQGADAPAQIVRAIAAIQRVRRLDVLIVGRGGGASEDLAAFNDERVARAIAACRVPVVSAVGHEVDHTVADLVADRRASTPTMAAEFCTPVFTEEYDRITQARARLGRAMQLKARTLRLALQRRAPRDPRRQLYDLRLRLDDLTRRAEDAVRARIARDHAAIDRAERTLAEAHPRARLATDAAMLEGLTRRLAPAIARLVERRTQRLDELDARTRRVGSAVLDAQRQRLALAAGRLDALSPVAILARGYGVVLHRGRALTHVDDVLVGDSITVRLHEGEIDARIESTRRP